MCMTRKQAGSPAVAYIIKLLFVKLLCGIRGPQPQAP